MGDNVERRGLRVTDDGRVRKGATRMSETSEIKRRAINKEGRRWCSTVRCEMRNTGWGRR